MEAISEASVFALLNRSEALAARVHMSVSAVADAGVTEKVGGETCLEE
jgi:hypothetical protein